jgi:hypothetical protein
MSYLSGLDAVEKNFACAGTRTLAFQALARRYADWAIPIIDVSSAYVIVNMVTFLSKKLSPSLLYNLKVEATESFKMLVFIVVKALCYKPEGRGFDTRWVDFLNLPNPSGRIRPWGLLSL